MVEGRADCSAAFFNDKRSTANNFMPSDWFGWRPADLPHSLRELRQHASPQLWRLRSADAAVRRRPIAACRPNPGYCYRFRISFANFT